MNLKLTTKDITLSAIFTALITIGAFIKIPFPGTPLSLQTLFIFLAGLLLGKRNGTIAVASYVIIGLLGVPIFTQGGGLLYVFQPSFGYLLGSILAAYIIGMLADRITNPSLFKYFIISCVGMLTIYLIGVPYVYLILTFYLEKTIEPSSLILTYALFLIPKDILSCLLAAFITMEYKKRRNNPPLSDNKI